MQKTQTICLIVLATIAIGFSLAYLKSVLLPFVIAIFLVIGCRPILEFIEKRLKLHRFVAFVVTFFFGVWLFFAFAFLVWISINDLSRNADAYEERLNYIATWVIERIPDSEKVQPDDSTSSAIHSQSGDADLAIPIPLTDSEPGDTVVGSTAAKDPSQAIQEFFSYISTYAEKQLLSVASSLSGLLSYGVLILIFVFFLLLENSQSDSNSANEPGPPAGIVGEIEAQIRKYLIMKTIISLLTGFVFGLVLWLFGVPLAIVFGFLAFLLNFIPNIGPLISTVLPVPFLILNSNMSPIAAIFCFVMISVIQFTSGNVIETRIMGKSFDVSPVFLLLSLMFFGLIWGIIGMFLATPIVSIVKIVLQQNEMGKPVAELMAGRWSGGGSRPV